MSELVWRHSAQPPFSLTVVARSMTVATNKMRARANLLILLGGLVLAIFYANPPEPIVVRTRADVMAALTRPPTLYEAASPWIKLAGFGLVGVGLALKLMARPRKRLSE